MPPVEPSETLASSGKPIPAPIITNEAIPAPLAPAVGFAPIVAAPTTVATALVSGSTAPGGWNWGAFLLSWIWGLGNGVWISLLALLPVGNIVMPFVLGAKGNEWAWKAKQWQSEDEFRRVQKKWTKAAVFYSILGIVLGIVGGVMIFFLATVVSVESRATATVFLNDLRDNRASDAYLLTSDEFRAKTSASEFDTFVNQESAALTSPKITSATVNSDNGISTSEVEAVSGGKKIVLNFVNVDKNWLVQSISIK